MFGYTISEFLSGEEKTSTENIRNNITFYSVEKTAIHSS